MRAFVLLLALCLALGAVAQTPFCTLDGTGVQPYETLVDKINSQYALQVLQLEPDKKARNSTVLMLASGTLYVSSDSGHSFTKVAATENEWFSQIIRTADSDVVFLPSGTDIWVTLDKGATFTQRAYDTSKYMIFADYCVPHPTQGKSLVCMSLNPLWPSKSGSRWQAVVTTDMGVTWEVVADYVTDIAWGYDPDHPTRVAIDALFISKVTTPTMGADQTTFSRIDYSMGEYVISTKHWTPKIEGCPIFFQSEGDFVAPSYHTNKKGEIVLYQIWHSEDHGQKWENYAFPINFYVWVPFAAFAADSGVLGYPFYITDNATFFFTWDSETNYALYVSDSQDHGYSKAIERLHGFDFAPFESINGVLVANSYVEDKGNAAHTSITYDNGGTWYPLRLPAGTRCPDRQPNCQLNLFGPTDDMFGRFYSWYDAVGLMIGTGTISEVLDRDGDIKTYLTADGGLNWVEIRDRPTTYEFGDHGGLLVLADSGVESTDIVYSWNGGHTFSQCSITDKAFNMYNIITGNASSTEFWVYGERTVGDKSYGVVILLDFSQFHESVCTPSDYEQFTPATPDNTSCILGQKTSYTRRKLDAECFNPSSWESIASPTICPCYEDDYECGYCYEYSKKDNACKWKCDPDDEGKAPDDCVDVWYPNSNGWRLVPSTQCNLDDPRSLKRLGTPEVCPGSGPSSTTTMVVLTVLFVIILLTILAAVGFIAYSQNDSVKRWVNEKLNQAPADTFSISESALSDKAPLASADE